MIKVGMDISQLQFNGGVVTYTKNLAESLERGNLDMIYFYSSLRKKYSGKLKNVKTYPFPSSIYEPIFNKFRFIPIEKFIGDIDIFHSSDWIQPPTKAKKVTTYHDTVPLKYPQWSHPKVVEVHKRRLKLVENEIDKVIAVSKSTKSDLIAISSIPSEKIEVIYEGVEEKFRPQDKKKVGDFKKKMSLPEEFILAIGGVGERRNLARLKEAAKRYNLVITGVDIPWVSEEELPLLYAGAKILAYPSLYEGFGLPVLEAQACGIPVVTSNTSSLPEVGGDAAIFVDPENTSDLKEKIDEAMNNNSLRSQLIKKGFSNSKKFTWPKCAQETEKLYRLLIN